MFGVDAVPGRHPRAGRRRPHHGQRATCSSPARSAAPTCPAATRPRCSAVAARRRAAPARHDARAARALPGHDDGAASGPPTPTCKDCPREHASRKSHRPAKVTPISGFPEYLPAERIVEQHFLDVIRETFELHGFSSDRDPVRSSRSSGSRARAGTPTRRSTASSGSPVTAADDDAALGPALRPDGARSPATSSRTPASSPSRSAATRSRRSGAASGPRRAATASSPRPTSTSSTWASSSPHFEAEMPLVIADVFSRFPVGEFVIQVNNRKIPERLLPGHRAHRRHRDAAHRRQARQARPGEGQGAARRVGRDARAGRPVPRARRDPHRPTSASSSRCARSASSTRCSTRASSRSPHVIRTGMAHAPGKLVADLRIARGLDYYTGTVYETQFVGSRVVGLVLLRRALRRARQRRAAPPTPASASRSA